MAPSSCLIAGVFPLSDGTRTTDPNYYATYLSALEFTGTNGAYINVSVRKYTGPAETVFPDDSFVFMVAKAALPPGEDGMLDPLHCTPFGSPQDGFYPYYPPEPTHTAFVTGTVSCVSNDGPIRSFTLETSEYVCNERRTFNIRFVSPQIFGFRSCLPTYISVLNLTERRIAGRKSDCQLLDL